MEKMLKAIVPVLISLCLTACIQQGRLPLEISQRTTINQSKEILISTQKELEAEKIDPNTTYVATAGIAGVLVGSVINQVIINNEIRRTNKIMTPLRYNLADYQFDDALNHQLTKELKSIKWLQLQPNKNELSDQALLSSQKRILTNNTGKESDVIIFVELSYKLSQVMLDTMAITANVQIYKKISPKAVLLYKNDFEYYEQLEKQKNAEAYVKIWSQNNAAKARESMHSAIKLLSLAIAKDISTPEIKPKKNQPTNVWYLQGLESVRHTAHMEEKIGNKYVLRTDSGMIVIANEPLVTRKHNWRE